MKKTRNLVVVLLALAACVNLGACNDDDDYYGYSNTPQLVGSWIQDSTYRTNGNTALFFEKDGHVTYCVFDGTSMSRLSLKKGRYAVKEDNSFGEGTISLELHLYEATYGSSLSCSDNSLFISFLSQPLMKVPYLKDFEFLPDSLKEHWGE